MFTRNSSAEPKTLGSRLSSANAVNGSQHHPYETQSTEKSVIGNDLKIIGQGLKIIGRGVLQVDGEIEGDVQAAEVIVGEKGQVTGMVAGRQVIVRGKVSGVVCAKTVSLQASSNVNGDIHHMSLLIEEGAMFDGRSRRAANEQALTAMVDGQGGQHATA